VNATCAKHPNVLLVVWRCLLELASSALAVISAFCSRSFLQRYLSFEVFVLLPFRGTSCSRGNGGLTASSAAVRLCKSATSWS
jgi:hypothetical protein